MLVRLIDLRCKEVIDVEGLDEVVEYIEDYVGSNCVVTVIVEDRVR